MALVRDLNRREGKTVAMVIHDLDLALRYSDYLVVMRKGRVSAPGPADEGLAASEDFHLALKQNSRAAL